MAEEQLGVDFTAGTFNAESVRLMERIVVPALQQLLITYTAKTHGRAFDPRVSFVKNGGLASIDIRWSEDG